MDNKQLVKWTLEAIDSVKSRAKHAMNDNDIVTYSQLMGDLYALEMCLVGDVTKLIEDLEKSVDNR